MGRMSPFCAKCRLCNLLLSGHCKEVFNQKNLFFSVFSPSSASSFAVRVTAVNHHPVRALGPTRIGPSSSDSPSSSLPHTRSTCTWPRSTCRTAFHSCWQSIASAFYSWSVFPSSPSSSGGRSARASRPSSAARAHAPSSWIKTRLRKL